MELNKENAAAQNTSEEQVADDAARTDSKQSQVSVVPSNPTAQPGVSVLPSNSNLLPPETNSEKTSDQDTTGDNFAPSDAKPLTPADMGLQVPVTTSASSDTPALPSLTASSTDTITSTTSQTPTIITSATTPHSGEHRQENSGRSSSSTAATKTAVSSTTQPPVPEQRPDPTAARPFTAKGVPKSCQQSIKLVARIALTETIERLRNEKTDEAELKLCEESYLYRLYQVLDNCANAVVKHTRDALQCALLEPNRFNELTMVSMKEKFLRSFTDGSYIHVLSQTMTIVENKAGKTTEISLLPNKIKDALTEHSGEFLMELEESNFFEETWAQEQVRNYCIFQIAPKAKRIIQEVFCKQFNAPVDTGHYYLQPTPDSNNHQIQELQKTVKILVKDRTNSKAAESQFIDEISSLKQDAAAADFERMERIIRIDANDKT